jgi:S1-C subfamily serine protease
VLAVPRLPAPAMQFAGSASRGAPGVVAGYPENGSLDLRAAAVAQRVQAQGQDIYGDQLSTRDIYAIRSTVRPGNSGGPLLTKDGKVLGVIFARSTSDPGTGYALTAAQVQKHAQDGANRTTKQAVDTGSRPAL